MRPSRLASMGCLVLLAMAVDGRRILFDTGAQDDTVLRNLKEMGLDLSGVEMVVLSHNHDDHTAGLLTLRRQFATKSPQALSRVYGGNGIFPWSPIPGP